MHGESLTMTKTMEIVQNIIINYSQCFLQGVLLSVPEAMEDLLAMKRLWVHEVLRVYYDRLVDDTDRDWIFATLHKVVASNLEENLNQMFAHLVKDKPAGSRVKQYYCLQIICLTSKCSDHKFSITVLSGYF